MRARIKIDHEKIAEFCRKHHIRKLWLFGSVLRDDFRPDSDVDVLYEFEEGHRVGWEIVRIEEELSELIGRRVDLIPEKYLKPRVRKHSMFSSEVVYER
ncbi:MAG TPA: nucleotidyltransferase [Bacteroidetes bacterium]|nr:nucleotidyltransferase [Bacteroidota bacterium]